MSGSSSKRQRCAANEQRASPDDLLKWTNTVGSKFVECMMDRNEYLRSTQWTGSFTTCDGKLKEALECPAGVFASFGQTVTPMIPHQYNKQVQRFMYEIKQNWDDHRHRTMTPYDKDDLDVVTAVESVAAVDAESPTTPRVYGVGLAHPDDPEKGLIIASVTGYIQKCGHRLLDEAWAGRFAVLFHEWAHVLHPSVFKTGVQAKTNNNDGGGHGEGFKLASRWCTSVGLTLVFLFFTGPYVIEMSSSAQKDDESAGKPQHISDLLLAGFRIRVMHRNVDSDPTRPLLPPSAGVTMDDLRSFDLHRDPTPQMISFIAVNEPGVKSPPGRSLPSDAFSLDDVWARELSKLTVYWTPPLDPSVPILRCTVATPDTKETKAGEVLLTITKANNYAPRPELAVDPRFCKTLDGSSSYMVAHGIAYEVDVNNQQPPLLLSTSGSGKPCSVTKDGRSLATFLDSNRNPDGGYMGRLIKMVVRDTLERGNRIELTFLRQAFESIFGESSWAFSPTDKILRTAIDKPLINRLFDIEPTTLFYIPCQRSEFIKSIWPAPPALPPLREISGPAAYSFNPVTVNSLEQLFLTYAASCTADPAPAPDDDDEDDDPNFRVSTAPLFFHRLMSFALRTDLILRLVDIGEETRFACGGEGRCLLSDTTPRVLCVPVAMPLQCRWDETSEANGFDAAIIKSVLINLDAAVDREMCTELSVSVALKSSFKADIASVCDEAIADVKREREKVARLLKERSERRGSSAAATTTSRALSLPVGISSAQTVSAMAASGSASSMVSVQESVPARPALKVIEGKFMDWLVEEEDHAAHPTEDECVAKATWAIPEVSWLMHKLLDLFSSPSLPFEFQFVYSPNWMAYGCADLSTKLILLNMSKIRDRQMLRHTVVHELGHLGTIRNPLDGASWEHIPWAIHNYRHNDHCMDISTWLLQDPWNLAVAVHAKHIRRTVAPSV